MASPWAWTHRQRQHHNEPSIESHEYRITNLEERMSVIDDLMGQFSTAINSIASELQTEVSREDDAIAAKFQPFADRLTALANDPTPQVPAAANASGGSGTAGGTSATGGSSTGGSSADGSGAGGGTAAGTPTAGGTADGGTAAGTTTNGGSTGGSASSSDAGAPAADGSTGTTATA